MTETPTTGQGMHERHVEASGGEPAKNPAKHVHHGRTPAAWAGTMITLVAFVVGGIGLILGNWVIFWIAVAMVVVAVIATLVLRKMGYGAD